MTRAGVPREERHARGLSDGLVRLSVGIEDVDDIIADLGQALERASGAGIGSDPAMAVRRVLTDMEARLAPVAQAAPSASFKGKPEFKRYGDGRQRMQIKCTGLDLAEGAKLELRSADTVIAVLEVRKGRADIDEEPDGSDGALRPKKAVNRLSAAMYPRCVRAVKPRTVMSSIMRRRNGLMDSSLMGPFLSR